MTDAPPRPPVRVRPALPTDAAALARVHVASLRAAYRGILPESALRRLSEEERAAEWALVLTRMPRAVLAAEAAGALVGFAAVGPSRDADAAGRVGEVYALYLEPAWWGGGVGWRLWSAARQALLVEEYAEATLWVLEQNTRARRFLHRAGLAPDPGSRRVVEVAGTPLPELRYRLRLD